MDCLSETVMQQERKATKAMAAEAAAMPDLVFERVVDYIHDPRDLAAASLVCRRWYAIDSSSRKHVTVALCYATTPQALDTRFPSLESLKLKAKPRAAMFDLIPEDWGGHVGPWVEEMARSFKRLKAVHFRRMIVRDSDIELLAKSRGKDLVDLKIDRCSGFSTDGLKHIGLFCKNLTTLSLEDSIIDERDGEWLHELALNNKNLKTLNFYLIELSKVDVQDLELIARNCPSLTSVKISECEILDLGGFFRTATALQEFGGGSFSAKPEEYSSISFPPRVSSLGLRYMGQNEMPIVFPVASLLTRLDLLYALLDTEDHCLLIQKCPNLEVLETRNVIGDRGLEVLGNCCKKLRRLRIEPGSDEQGMFNEGGRVTHTGLIAMAQGCPELEYLAVYVSDITNAALECIGTFLTNLSDFRLVLLDQEERIAELPLDNGVRALLQGCNKLRRFALYLRPGGLTNAGLGYIGMYTPNVRWMLLGYVGESDAGLLEFSRGCRSLQKLEIRGCIFSEHALAIAALELISLRYFWVQGYPASETGHDLLAMARPFWNIELIPARQVIEGDAVVREDPAHMLAYYSLVGQRTDFPDTVVPLEPPALLNE